MNDRAAELRDDRGVFAFGIDNEGASPAEQCSDELDLDHEGFAGTAGREDDGVVILEREAVEDDCAAGRSVDAVQLARASREIAAREWECR